MAERTTKERRAANASRAKLAQMAAAEKRQRTRQVITFSAIGLLLVVVVAMVAVKLSASAGGSGKDVSATASVKVASAVTSVPSAVYDKVGNGGIQAAPRAIPGQPVATDGKPRVLYVGAEYCPFCAAERWPVAAALSRFGKWSGLGQTSSTTHDYAPATPTLSFHGATYTSKYLSFTGYETADRNGQPLDSMSSADQRLFTKYDAPPYVPSDAAHKIPFMLLGGKYVVNGASYDPVLLHGMTTAQVAQALHDPNSKVAKAVEGSANEIAAALCKLTGGQPAAVCSSAGVRAGAANLLPTS